MKDYKEVPQLDRWILKSRHFFCIYVEGLKKISLQMKVCDIKSVLSKHMGTGDFNFRKADVAYDLNIACLKISLWQHKFWIDALFGFLMVN